MITNQRQYDITTEWIERFEQSVAVLRDRANEGDENARQLRRIEVAGMLSQIETLREQFAEYDALRSGPPTTLRAESLAELSVALIKARIAAGLTEQQLAEQLGVPAERVEHDEDNDYQTSSFAHVTQVAAVLDPKLSSDIALPARTDRVA